VSVGGTEYGLGEGRSKKQAEQAAARTAWQALSVPVAVVVVEASTLGDPLLADPHLADPALDDPIGTDASLDVDADA
jgi:hypothetical protein